MVRGLSVDKGVFEREFSLSHRAGLLVGLGLVY